MHYPPFVKFSSLESADLFYKIETRHLLEEGGKQNALENFNKVVAKACKTNYALEFSYRHQDGDNVSIETNEALQMALEECPQDCLKVFITMAGTKSYDQDPAVSYAEFESLKNQVQHLKDELQQMKVENEAKQLEQAEVSNFSLGQTVLEAAATRENTTTEKSVARAPARITLIPELAFLWGKKCFLVPSSASSSQSSPTLPRIEFQDNDSVAFWCLSKIVKQGLYRVVIEIADCNSVGDFLYAGVIREDPKDYHYESLLSSSVENAAAAAAAINPSCLLRKVDLVPTISLPRYYTNIVPNSRLIAGPFHVEGPQSGQTTTSTRSDENFVITGSTSPFSVLSVTFESMC
mmetsp:Transcript_12393/g.16270  ORF Transcript_12393/g.16270 Transcript_12393/m.16270 type:complete len:350 (+) Transcript_12393:185-1234(+)|eukprot:CAMPEP_0198139162 /NCGR_PEP_ID=MMETSP1443-20131203/2505_1 /TAXON_ID=186043 /ORGANISM="Entomoneis sp., Strain CCMP2396" /LENGTH=349 /DNA_ID=CAMNT_0043801211 /DNA_START=133 /DNA_END=1182 /DNA_ORIENTATION=+